MEELILLCGKRSKEQIDRAVAYLIKEFPMARDAKLAARETTEKDPDYLRNWKAENWIATVPAEYSRYTSTIDKMRQAVQDYENGWRDAGGK